MRRTAEEWLQLAIEAEAEGLLLKARAYETAAAEAESSPDGMSEVPEYQGPSARRVATLHPRQDLPGEEWRDIRGYEGIYQISSHGRLWSMTRRKESKLTESGFKEIGGRYIHGTQRNGPYDMRIAALSKGEGPMEWPVAALVAEAFWDVACLPEFRDGNPNNCALSNLILRAPSQRVGASVRKIIKLRPLIHGRQRLPSIVLDRTHLLKKAENLHERLRRGNQQKLGTVRLEGRRRRNSRIALSIVVSSGRAAGQSRDDPVDYGLAYAPGW